MLSKDTTRHGFTMAELLVVVAIIAVLVGVAIPVFTGQLEKSREATDLANIRSAYAEVMANANMGTGVYESGDIILVQKRDGWQNGAFKDVLSELGSVVGEPEAGGTVSVAYKPVATRASVTTLRLAAASAPVSNVTIIFSGAVPGDQATIDAQLPGVPDEDKKILLSLAAAERQALKLYTNENTDQAMGYLVKWKPDGSFELTRTVDSQSFDWWSSSKITNPIAAENPKEDKRGYVVMVTTINGKVMVGSNLRFDPETKRVTAIPYHVKCSNYGKRNDLVEVGKGDGRVWNEDALIY